MNDPAAADRRLVARQELLLAFKRQMASRDPTGNVSPFANRHVVGYASDVAADDVPDIHGEVRQAITDLLKRVRQGDAAQIVILAGEPGMGKSHILRHFCRPGVCEDLGLIAVSRSNHWRVEEFENVLLDWTLASLVAPAPGEPHLLLDRMQEVCFLALSQLIEQPRNLGQYISHGPKTWLRRIWGLLFHSSHGRFKSMIANRDASVFRLLDFAKFSDYVCDRFLHHPSNVFHRFALKVLLRYVFAEDRELVLHWLRGEDVGEQMLRKLGRAEKLDKAYKVFEALQIVLALFGPEVGAAPRMDGAAMGGRTFLFAFDQIEGREALFDNDDDWRRFFAQLSELYNSTPNVFVLFTMTLGLRNRLYDRMEQQFRDRIRMDQKFVLHGLQPDEILELYQHRLGRWVAEGGGAAGLADKMYAAGDPTAPFAAAELVELCRGKTIRAMLRDIDVEFRRRLAAVVDDDPGFELRYRANEWRAAIEADGDALGDHLQTVRRLFLQAEDLWEKKFGVGFRAAEVKISEDRVEYLELCFEDPTMPTNWIRATIVRLGYQYKAAMPGCIRLLANKKRGQNRLWLLREGPIDHGLVPVERREQVAAAALDGDVEANLRAVLSVYDFRDRYRAETWGEAEAHFADRLRSTYLGDLLQTAAALLVREREAPVADRSEALA